LWLCSELSYSTFASVTYASFHVGAVYESDNRDWRFSQYGFEGNLFNNPQINNGAMCSAMVV